MTARTVVAIGSVVAALASAGCLSFYEIAGRDADSGEARRHAVPARARRRLPRRRLEEHRSEHRDGAAASKPAPHQVGAQGHRRRRAARSSTKWIAGAAPAAARRPRATHPPMSRRSRTRRTCRSTSRSSRTWSSGRSLARSTRDRSSSPARCCSRKSRRAAWSRAPQPFIDDRGITRYVEQRQFSNMKGFALTPKFVFIDGRTGAQLYSESFHEEALYQDRPEHAGALVVLRADGQAPAGLPEHAQHAEDQRHADSAEVDLGSCLFSDQGPENGNPRPRVLRLYVLARPETRRRAYISRGLASAVASLAGGAWNMFAIVDTGGRQEKVTEGGGPRRRPTRGRAGRRSDLRQGAASSKPATTSSSARRTSPAPR